MRDGMGGALMNSGGIDGSGRARNLVRLVLAVVAVVVGLVVVGGGIALFLSALLG